MSSKEHILICALVSLSFGSSLFGDFVFDDTEALLKNPDIDRSLFDTRIFANDFWGNHLHKPESHKSYRPLTILVYKCIRQISALLYHDDSKLHPLGFRIANFLSYTLLCCLLQSTLCLFLAGPIIGNSPARAKKAASLVTLLFAVHPLHTESVNSAVGLSDILSALCCVLALRVYLQTQNLLRIRQVPSVSVKFTVWSFVIVLLTGFALFFKEQGITYMVNYFKIHTMVFVNNSWILTQGIFILLNLNLLTFHTASNDYRRFAILLQTCLFLISAFSFLYCRLWVMNFSRPSFSPADNPASHISSLLFRYINYGHIYMLNLLLIVCPIWLCFDWSMGCVPMIETFSDLRLVSLTLLIFTFSVIFFYLLILINHSSKR